MHRTRRLSFLGDLYRRIMTQRRFYVRYVRSFAERIINDAGRRLFRRRVCIVADAEAFGGALSVQNTLGSIGVPSAIVSPDAYSERFWRTPMVICSRVPKRLPEKYYLVQNRDLSSGAVIDDAYLRLLKNAVAVLDCSMNNIELLLGLGISYKNLFYLPLEFDSPRFLARFLLAVDYISYSEFYTKAGALLSLGPNPRICLSLPETIERRRSFMAQDSSFAYFDGLRHKYAWVGCGMSYKYLCQMAMNQGLDYLIIAEDDALLQESFEKDLAAVLSYLSAARDSWHVFSGFIANLDKSVEIRNVVSHCGIEFVHINRLTSTVLNIYHRSIFDRLSKWDEENYHFYTNTIDRFLGNWKDLKVVTTIPFLVGHREDVVSSIWGFENTQYSPMVVETIQRLEGLVRAFKSGE